MPGGLVSCDGRACSSLAREPGALHPQYILDVVIICMALGTLILALQYRKDS